jgi:integrase
VLGRDGRWRFYLRKPGLKRVALAGLYGSEEFAASYRLALAGSGAAPSQIGASRTVAGSLNQLIAHYQLSKYWTAPPPDGLARNSKHTRRPIMEKLRTGPWAAVLVRDLSRRHICAVLDGVAAGHAKKHWLKTLRALFAFGIELGLREDDPSVGIKVKVAGGGGYHSWTAEEVERYRGFWRLGTQQRLAMELALETASRRCEIVRLGRQHVGRDGRIRIERGKGSNAVDIRLSPELAAALAATPPSDHLTFLVAGGGLPLTPEQLGAKFRQWATAAGLPQRCTLHGLRKARSAQLAAAGASAHQIMSITGHKSLAEVQRYADKFNRRQAADAAMSLLLKTGTAL